MTILATPRRVTSQRRPQVWDKTVSPHLSVNHGQNVLVAVVHAVHCYRCLMRQFLVRVQSPLFLCLCRVYCTTALHLSKYQRRRKTLGIVLRQFCLLPRCPLTAALETMVHKLC